jgi:hypothetical protein
VADQKPPRSNGDERTVLLALLRYQRESFVRKVEGITDDDARRALVGSGTTLLWLTKHVAEAEQLWLVRRFAGRDVALDGEVRPDDTIAAAIESYRAVWPVADAILLGNDLDAEVVDPAGGPVAVNLRWIGGHLLEEVARHAGHADILRELLDGDTGR